MTNIFFQTFNTKKWPTFFFNLLTLKSDKNLDFWKFPWKLIEANLVMLVLGQKSGIVRNKPESI